MQNPLSVVKPALPSSGNLITEVKTIRVNTDGATGSRILNGLPPLCLCHGGYLLSEVLCPFGQEFIKTYQ